MDELCYSDIQIGDRVKIKFDESNPKIPKNIHGLWITVEGINQVGNPTFWCPRKNNRRTIREGNVDRIERHFIRK